MKTWFVYYINEKKVGTWANNEYEARKNLIAEYGNVPMEYIGMYFGDGIGETPDEIVYRGMSAVDSMIAHGYINMFIGFR